MYASVLNSDFTPDAYDRILNEKVGYGNYQRIALIWLGLVYASIQSQVLAICIILPTIQIQWDLNLFDLGLIGTSMFVGIFIGYLMVNHMSDTLGRRPTILLSVLLQVIFGVGSALVTNESKLLVTVAVLGLSLGFTMLVPTFLNEIFPTKKRSRGQIILQAYLVYGIVFTIVIASIVFSDPETDSWRVFLCVTAAPSLITFFGVLLFVDESPRFLILKGSVAAGFDKLNEIAKKNQGIQKDKLSSADNYELFMWQGRQAKELKNPGRWQDLISSENKRKALCLLLIWLGLNYLYYGMIFILPIVFEKLEYIGRQEANNYLLFALCGEIPSIFIVYLFIERKDISRKTALLISSIVIFLTLIAIPVIQEGYVFWCLVMTRMGLKVCFLMVQPLTIDSFPPVIRSKAFKIISFLGRLSSTGIPITCILFYKIDEYIPFIAFGAVALVIVFAVLVFPVQSDDDDLQVEYVEMEELNRDRNTLIQSAFPSLAYDSDGDNVNNIRKPSRNSLLG